MPLKVAVIGRPNVGKSTLFNRLVGYKLAIVHDTPGVTRDRKEAMATFRDLELCLIDTAGFEYSTEDNIEQRMWKQTRRAIDEADVCLFMIDARSGLHPYDEIFAGLVRESHKPVILLANKCEGKNQEDSIFEAYKLGLGQPIPFSAEHGLGLSDLYDALLNFTAPEDLNHKDEKNLVENNDFTPPHSNVSPEITSQKSFDVSTVDLSSANNISECAKATNNPQTQSDGDNGTLKKAPHQNHLSNDKTMRPIQLAIVGRPNVGKSTLVNALLRDERMLTGPEAGITRDAITTEWQWNGRQVNLVDTAGLRRQAKINDSLEKMSAASTKHAAFMAQVVILVLDADAILDKQDLTIARQVIEEGRALVIAVNKWDIANRAEAIKRLNDKLQTSLTQVVGIPTVTISALKREGLDKLMSAVFKVYDRWNARIPTAPLNKWFADVQQQNTPPLGKNKRRIKLKYITQAKTRPPSFYIFSSNPEGLPDSYLRYLTNSLRETFNLGGVPIRITVRKSDNPYAGKK